MFQWDSVMKSAIKRTFFYSVARRVAHLLRIRRASVFNSSMYLEPIQDVEEWEKKGRPVPPPHLVKQKTVKEYAAKFSTGVFVETGTYLGDMVSAMKDSFHRIVSIELDVNLYRRAKRRFEGSDNILILQGDSSEELPRLLANIGEPCLFWLDGHYCHYPGGKTAKGALETPIMEELKCILGHSVAGHIILIDDARLFLGDNDYPTLEEVQCLVQERRPDWVFEVQDDIIRTYERQYG